MTIDKRQSGSYRIRQMVDGRIYTVTVPYKPTKKEAFELIQNKMNHKDDRLTLKEAGRKYIDAKCNVLSPATIREYESKLRSLPKYLLECDLEQIDDYLLQRFVNEYSADHAPKSTRNMYGFVIGVIKLFYPHTTLSAKLPPVPRKERYVPTHEDVTRILDAVKGTKYHVPLYLACLSLRCSEICALSIFDLKGNNLTINKALVRSNNGYVLKDTPKTDKSNRVIVLPQDLADEIREQGYVYKGYPRQIDKCLRRIQKKLSIPAFGVHTLRHYFASYSHELGYSDAVIQAVGGWSTDYVMKSVYRHAMDTDAAKVSMANDFCLSRD